MAVTTWTFLTSFEGWKFEDQSSGGGTAARSHIPGALKNSLTYPDFTVSEGAALNSIPGFINVVIAAGDKVELDRGAASDGIVVATRITAYYTDATTDTTFSQTIGASTHTLNLTSGKTLENIEIRNSIGNGGSVPARSVNVDNLEVRLTHTNAIPTQYNVLQPVQVLPGENVSAMGVNQSGTHLFIAMQSGVTGFPLVIKIDRPTSTTPTQIAVYEPTAGTNANIAKTGNFDRMLFFGNFGTDVGVIDHAIAAVTNTDISPTSIGAKIIQPLRADPGDIDHIIAINRDDQDAIETEDGGSNWSALNAALGIEVDAMDIGFFGPYIDDVGVIGGDDGADQNLSYTPNEFTSLREDTSAALKAVSNIVSVDRVSSLS
jgi:hypothetical protein